ncbi:uncharacterized protein METZ01_LOCUS226291, partial [marine metagenome]
MIAIISPYPSTKINFSSKYDSPPLIISYYLTPSFLILILNMLLLVSALTH